MQALITGNSSGLGRGLTRVGLEKGWTVYGTSRRGSDLDHERLHDVRCDLSELEAVGDALAELLGPTPELDLVVLNAGMLGEIGTMPETPVADLKAIMEVNVWANKVILDWLHRHAGRVDQVVMISSGASVLGNRGWSGYALSKAALNILARLYSHEFPDSHLSALAPGLVDTALIDEVLEVPDPDAFPGIRRIEEARGTERMPGPVEAARKVIGVLPQLRDFPSGDFVDIRQILAPREYEELMKARNR